MISPNVPLVFEKPLTVTSSHVNAHRRLRTSVLLRLLQDISTEQTEAFGVGRDKVLDRGYLWVVSRQYLEITRLPVYDERILLATEPAKMMHLFFPRFYSITDQSGETLLSGEALWLLMDAEKRTALTAFPEDIMRFPGTRRPEHVLNGALRPPEGLHRVLEVPYTARFSQLDFNGHIGNTHYFDIIEDMMSPGDTERTPRSIRAEYRAEILPGEEIRIAVFSDHENIRFFEGYSETGDPTHPKIRFRILIRY